MNIHPCVWRHVSTRVSAFFFKPVLWVVTSISSPLISLIISPSILYALLCCGLFQSKNFYKWSAAVMKEVYVGLKSMQMDFCNSGPKVSLEQIYTGSLNLSNYCTVRRLICYKNYTFTFSLITIFYGGTRVCNPKCLIKLIHVLRHLQNRREYGINQAFLDFVELLPATKRQSG